MTDEPPEEFRQFRFTLPASATDLLLVRHGESAPARLDQPAPTIEGGHSDPELDPVGQAQARRLADRLAHEPIDAIYVTPLRRTQQTAAPLAERLGLTPQVEHDLREVHLGEWEGGLFRKHTEERHPLAIQMFLERRWDVIPGAESNDTLAARVQAGLDRIVAANPGKRVVVVAHGGVIGQCMALATGAPAFAYIGSDNASISQLVALPAPLVVRRFNDTAHLDDRFTLVPTPLT